MIKTLRLRNFKAFQDTGDIELKPITVLAGPNSGGKSSVLHALLLLRQTIETQDPDIELSLDGRFLQYSSFDELTFGKPPIGDCEVRYEIGLDTPLPGKVVPRYFPSISVPGESESLPVNSRVEFCFQYRKKGDEKPRVIMAHFDMKCSAQDTIGPQMTIDLREKGYEVEIKGFDLDSYLPDSMKGQKIVGAGGHHFLPTLLALSATSEEEEGHLLRLPSIFWRPLRDLEDELQDNLRYLGPLRGEPERAYLHSGSTSREIGKRGEYAAQILWLEKDDEVQYQSNRDQRPTEFTLLNAVADAFRQLGITQPIDVSSEKSIMYQILFGIGDPKNIKQVTIADVGFGVSQLLPIIVMGIRSPEGSVLLFEQPEIHLHPKLQSNLADFFLTLAASGKRILVETHSDHLINRLRRRIAEDQSDQLKEQISILFVHPPRNGQGATIEPLRVDQYGIIENWPEDFLPEAADEAAAIVEAGIRKRRGN